ncbi:hypothetical protein FRC00_007046 [Tulasnella sp. 408]|nr:hypothetical protein FRC00_007046 [Tulasnella sp. 408]
MPVATTQGQPPVTRAQYRLPIEALDDEKKLKAQIISMNTGLDVTYLVAEAVPIPGLGQIVLMAKKAIHTNSSDRETLQLQRQELANLCYLLTANQMMIDPNDVFMNELHRSSSEIHALEEQIYNIRMDPTIDTSSLPADISIEVKPCTHEKQINGTQYVVRRGKWLNRDIVALKFPKNFGVLRCSMECGGTEELCFETQRHTVAAKAMERFRRQVDIWRTLKHPNVLKLYGWCKWEGNIYLVTPWLEAGNAKHFCRSQKLSDIQILNMIRDIALGLRYIHSKDVVHAALSPKNVLILPDGTAVIGDFSRAKIVPPERGFSQITDTTDDSTFMRYQAPEEQREPRPMSPKGDIFSWSMVSLEIISKVEPYPGQGTASLIFERVMLDKRSPTREEHPSALWEKCSGLWELLRSCQELDRLQRPSLDSIISKLDEYIEKEEENS